MDSLQGRSELKRTLIFWPWPWPVWLGLFATSAGWALWGGPRDPDEVLSARAIVGTGLLSFAFALSVLGWGRLLSRREDRLICLITGSAALSLAGMLLGTLGLAGESFRWLWIAILVVGISAQGAWNPLGAWRELGDARWAWACVWAVVASYVVRAALVYAHSDPLIYHLLAPRVWWATGQIRFDELNPGLFVASYWETLLLWGNAIFQGEAARGTIEGQLFAQWVHVYLGGVGSAWAIARVFSRMGFPRWAPLFAVAGVASYPLLEFAPVAKNDWGSILWLAGAMVFLQDRRSLEAGALAGLGFIAKPSALFALPALLVMTLWKATPRTILLFAIGGFAVSFPTLARNFSATGNPVFPWLNSWFPSEHLGPSLNEFAIMQSVGLDPTRMFVARKLSLLAEQSPIGWAYLLGLLAPAALPAARGFLPLALGFAASILLFLIWPVRSEFMFRWLGLVLLLSSAIGAMGLVAAVERLLPPRARHLTLVTLVAFFSWSIFLTHDTAQLWRGAPANERILSSQGGFVGGDAKSWLRKHAPSEHFIVTTADNQLYYISHLRTTTLYAWADLDREAHATREASSLLEVLRARGATHLLDTLHWETLFGRRLAYWGHYSRTLNSLVVQHPEAIAFAGEIAIVVDLKRLEELVFRRCSVAPELLSISAWLNKKR